MSQSMARFLDLPPEIIVHIFKFLHTVDDALHLARCCRIFQVIFDPINTRLAVFRSIIKHASHHEHDKTLSRYIGVYGRYSLEFYCSLPIVEDPIRRRSLVSQIMYEYEELPDETVWEIVSRWHGLRILFDLYCDKSINESYAKSIFPYIPEIGTLDTTDAMAREPNLCPPEGDSVGEYKSMMMSLKQQCYQRFYKAVSRHWLSTELLWLVKTQYFPNAAAFEDAIERVSAVWCHNPTRPIREKIDIIEAVDFVWGFLARKAFQVSEVPDWLQGLDETIYVNFVDDRAAEADNWGFFVRNVFQYLRPPHVIELLLSMWSPSAWQINKPRYLLQLGLFDTCEGILADTSEPVKIDTWFPINAVEIDVESSLSQMEYSSLILARWEQYRYFQWSREARARIFLDTKTSAGVIGQIKTEMA